MTPLVLGLLCADDPEPSARSEFVRILVAARAAGRPVRLLDLRPPPAPSPASNWPEPDARLFEALLADGVHLEVLAPPELVRSLAAAPSVVRLGSRRRAHHPAVLALSPPEARASSPAYIDLVREAGQVLP